MSYNIFNALVSNQSSLSKKVIQLPFATFNPAFLAELAPPFSLCITWMRLSFSAHSLHICKLLSGDPSSTSINSKSKYVCFKTDCIQRSKYLSAL